MKPVDGRPGYVLVQGTSRLCIGARCSKCGDIEAGSDKPSCPPEVVARHFTAKGWKITRAGAAAVCPKCQVKIAAAHVDDTAAVEVELERQRQAEQRRAAAEDSRPTLWEAARAVIMAPRTEEGAMSTEMYRAQRRLYELLGDHFTTAGETGSYDDGWSDARLAKETGIALAEVLRIREAAFGRIVDPRIARLEVAIAEEHARRTRELTELRTMLEATAAESEQTLASLRAQLAELQGGRP